MRVVEVAQRVYAELVLRRARVRVVAAVPDPPATDGAFLLGLYRSGTTPVRYVLDSHSAIACPPESEFLVDLVRLLDSPRGMTGLEAMGFDRDHTVAKVREVAHYFLGNYAASRSRATWVDKTPGYVEILHHLEEVFPEARFVVVHRHPLDQVHSHTRGGTVVHGPVERFVRPGEDVRVAAARYWAHHTDALLALERRRAGRCLRVRYEDVCARPEDEFRRLFGFLGVGWEPEALDYRRAEHDVGREGGKALGKRGFPVSSGGWRRWPADVVAECLPAVAAPMAALGYEVAAVEVPS